jgi:hypothetical protein
MASNRRPFSFNFIFGNRKKSQGAKSEEYGGWGMAAVFFQKLLGEDGVVRRRVVMAKQPSLFSPMFGATCLHVFTQSAQNFAVGPGIDSLAYWYRCFALPQLLYRWRHQSGIYWIQPRISTFYPNYKININPNIHPIFSFIRPSMYIYWRFERTARLPNIDNHDSTKRNIPDGHVFQEYRCEDFR